MKKTDRDIITKELGVQSVMIDSLLSSGQIRKRLYWTNIPFVIPMQRQVQTELKDVLETSVDDWYYLKQGSANYILSHNDKWVRTKFEVNPLYAKTIVATCWKTHRADTDNYVTTEYCPEGKTNFRRLTPTECERLQTLPDGYTIWTDDNIPIGQMNRYRYEMIGNAWTVDVIAHILKGIKRNY
jgi:DNA (cytosine-5)-methyltransferase 3A